MDLVIREKLCPKNHVCPAVKMCPVDALTQEGMSTPAIEREKCIACGKCAKACPTGALQMED
jgi:ferredoxin